MRFLIKLHNIKDWDLPGVGLMLKRVITDIGFVCSVQVLLRKY